MVPRFWISFFVGKPALVEHRSDLRADALWHKVRPCFGTKWSLFRTLNSASVLPQARLRTIPGNDTLGTPGGTFLLARSIADLCAFGKPFAHEFLLGQEKRRSLSPLSHKERFAQLQTQRLSSLIFSNRDLLF